MFKRDSLPQFKVELKAIQTFTQDILCYLYLGLVVQKRRQYFAVPRLYNYSASSQLLPHFQSSKHLRSLVQHHVSRLILGLSNPDNFLIKFTLDMTFYITLLLSFSIEPHELGLH